jgi:hypothetical protein
MVPIRSEEDLSPEQRATLQKVRKRFEAAEKLHKLYEPRWNIWYGLSRNYRRLQRAHAQASTPNDKDTVIEELRRVYGDELFIPYAFAIIETVLPRVLSNSPEMSVRPLDPMPETVQACEPLKQLFERDQAAEGYETKLQETVRSGLRYGLGVQKDYWRRRYRHKIEMRRPILDVFGPRRPQRQKVLVSEGPCAESVDIFDFFWDPNARDLETCDYVIHRTYRTDEYVKEKVETGEWANIDPEFVEKLGSEKDWSAARAERMNAAGLGGWDGGGRRHEVWECHDRDEVLTVLDRCVPVQEAVNPFAHGDLPFAIYRPTIVEQEFVGIGEIEPIAHLQYELNMLRGQRRDAATLALNRNYFYSEGMIDPTNVVAGIGVWVPVFGDPKEAVFPAPFTDIPQSSTEEESAIKGDIELASGISEAVTGGEAAETATGTQLVQGAASIRIKQKAKNLHIDLLRPATAGRRELYRQYIVSPEQTQTIRVDDPKTPTGYSFLAVGPDEVNANVEISPVDGSTEPDDTTQRRADAVQLAQAIAPFAEAFDPKALVRFILVQFGIEQPEEWLTKEPDIGEVIQTIGQKLAEEGLPEDKIIAALQSAAQAHGAPAAPGGEGQEEQGAPEPPAPSTPEPAAAAAGG